MNHQPDRRRGPRPRGRLRRLAAGLLACVALVVLLPGAAAQGDDGCAQAGKNRQCSSFGSITMDTTRAIRGTPIDLATTFTLNTTFAEQDARWVLVSLRNVEADGSDPIMLELVRFGSAQAAVATSRVEQPRPGEINLWVETLDTPVGEPLTLDARVGSTQRGAFQVETLVMAFDRAYAPMSDEQGAPASLYASTLLGVNQETSIVASDPRQPGDGGGGLSVPALPAALALVALAGVAALLRRSRP